MRRLLATAFALALALPALAQNAVTLANVRKIYVEKMPDNLDQYLVSEISKKFHGSLTIVLNQSEADAILHGVNLTAQNTSNGTVQLVDPKGTTVLWSGSANDRSMMFLDLKHGGQQKIASHLIDQLKKAMQK
jgi:F420-0:gamma-glutamyl ligase-like protein